MSVCECVPTRGAFPLCVKCSWDRLLILRHTGQQKVIIENEWIKKEKKRNKEEMKDKWEQTKCENVPWC